MKQFIRSAAFCCFLLSLTSISFPQSFCWSSIAGGNVNDRGECIVTDITGNAFVSGMTQSGVCFFKTDTLITQGENDMFVAKYDISGNEVWVMQLGGNNENGHAEYIGNMVFDTIRNRLLLCGRFYGTLTLPDTTVYSSKMAIFLLSMDLDRHLLWIRTFTGIGNSDILPFGVSYDMQGCVYISGSDYAPVNVNGISIEAGGFLAKYDINGNILWAKNNFRYYSMFSEPYPPYTETVPDNLMCVDGHLLVNGQVQNDTIIVDTIIVINQPGSAASYLASFSEGGVCEWIRLVGLPLSENGRQFGVDDSSNVYLTGWYKGTCVFGNDTLTTNAGGDGDCFLTKLSPIGKIVWTRNLNASISAIGSGLVLDALENVYLSGLFYGTAQFGNTTISSIGIQYENMFLTQFSLDGVCNGVRQYPSGNISNMSLNYLGEICMTGYFYDSLPMGENTFYSHGERDFFIGECSPITSTKESPSAPSNQLLIYANPTTGKCNITVPDELKNDDHLVLYIYDSNGRLIQKANIERTSETYQLDIRAQAAGVYQAVLTNGSKSYSGKIVFTGK